MKVVIAFIRNRQHQLLITQRAPNTSFGGYWELPGGKVDYQEDNSVALRRELKEELGLDVNEILLFKRLQLEHEFLLFDVKYSEQEISLHAGQLAYQWVFKEEIDVKLFPPSNKIFFEAWNDYLLDAN